MSCPSRSQSVAMITRAAPFSSLRMASSLAGLPPPRAGGGGGGALGLEQGEGPALPGRVDLLGLGEAEQVALGREDGAVAVADGGADVAGLAGLLGDDERLHAGPGPSAFVGTA